MFRRILEMQNKKKKGKLKIIVIIAIIAVLIGIGGYYLYSSFGDVLTGDGQFVDEEDLQDFIDEQEENGNEVIIVE